MKRFIRNFLYKCIELVEKIEYRGENLDENDISKKIIFSQDIDDIQVESDTGWVDVSNIHITQPYTIWELELQNGYTLKCADNHIIFKSDLQEVFVKDLKIGDEIHTDIGGSKVVKLVKYGSKVSMGDLTIDHPNHRYYTNGILSHNTITAAIYILHFMMFNNTKNVLLAANVLDTSKEVLDKMKNIYEYLPFFLQQGIVVWNVGQITFENKSRAKAFAMTKNASIGNTGDLVYIDEFAHIPNNVANKFYKSIFPTLASIENSKMIITSTPNGFNLFHKLLTDAEREDTDPLKNNFKSLRVYWYQVPGRNVTYMKINSHLLPQYYLTQEMMYEQCKELFNPNDKVTTNGIPIVEMKPDSNSGQMWIRIQNNEKLKFENIITTEFINERGERVHCSNVAQLSTWKLDAMKDIGGEDNFNQEYDLRFAAGSRSVVSEATIERLTNGKKEFKHLHHLDTFKKLKWDWSALKFIEDWDESKRKNIHGMITIDVSEGLGQDYSVINMFNLRYKSTDLIKEQKESFQKLQDFFQLSQFGLFRSNVVSVQQLAEICYLLVFEFFDPDKFKIVVEYNNDGKAFLQALKGVFEGENDYSGHVILKFKHRIDAKEKSPGLKVGGLKNQYVKDYQERLENQEFLIYHDVNIQEIGTFISHTTAAGNTVYKGDGAHDDLAMSVVNMSQGWNNSAFKELILDYHDNSNNAILKKMVNEILNNEKSFGTDYGSFFKGKSSFQKRIGGGNINPASLF
jgi:hypothetical protein